MNEQHKYRATDKMSDLICDNYSLLMVMSRFGLSLGFGDKSVKDVCEAQHVDYRTFLAVANFISEEQYSYSADNDSFSIPALMDYLKRAHAYFLDFNLPAMRRKLIEAKTVPETMTWLISSLSSLTNTPKKCAATWNTKTKPSSLTWSNCCKADRPMYTTSPLSPASTTR